MNSLKNLSLLIAAFFTLTWSAYGQDKVSHDTWNDLLKKNVSTAGKVNYKAFIKDSLQLNKYLDLLSKNAPTATWSKNESMAYWINAYNAFTVRLVIRNYPLKSIKDIGGKVPFVNSTWDIKFIKIGKETLDLNNIEHTKLRKAYGDPRLHFALVCASASCPKLLNEAYVAAKLDAQLDAQATTFINDSFKNKTSADAGELSKIFDWYKGDFTKKGSLIDYINKYAKVKMKATAKISYLTYSWALNE